MRAMRTTMLVSLSLLLAACAGNEPAPAAPATPSTTATLPPAPTTATSATTPTTAATPAPAVAPEAAAPTIPPYIQAALDATDRDEKDRALDKGRHAAEMLAFFGIAPGEKVGEIAAGGGYTTELLARVVGPSGVVYAENPPFIVEKFAAKPWAARLAKPVNKNVKRQDREADAPFSPEAKDLDAVVDVLFYHDTVWLKADRDKMNKAIFDALKHGGVYGIVDHSGRAGTGTGEVQTLHRIDEKAVVDEVTKAGFKLAGEGGFMRNASDPRDWNASPMAAGDKRGTSDRFVLKFVKP